MIEDLFAAIREAYRPQSYEACAAFQIFAREGVFGFDSVRAHRYIY
jgi:hypothetical protein